MITYLGPLRGCLILKEEDKCPNLSDAPHSMVPTINVNPLGHGLHEGCFLKEERD